MVFIGFGLVVVIGWSWGFGGNESREGERIGE